MIEEINLWPSPIWRFKYEFDSDLICSKALELLSHWSVSSESSILEVGNALSTAPVGVYDTTFQPHNMEILLDYHTWLSDKIAFIWDKFGFTSKSSEISKSWFNIHKLTGQTLEHAHNRADLVISAYIKCPKGSGNIEFRDPLEYHKLGFQYNLDRNLWKQIEVETNDVLIFPGWLNHRTQENKTDQERIVMTYNINAKS